MRAFSVIFTVTAREGCMATRQLCLEDVVQKYSSDNGSDLEHFLDDNRDLWPGFSTKLVLKSTVQRRLQWRTLAIRTVSSAPSTEAGIKMNLTTRMSTRFPEKLDFAAGDKICSHDGHLMVSRGEILLVDLLVHLVQLLAC